MALKEDEIAYHERETETGPSMSVPNSFTSWDDFDADPYTSVVYPSMSTPDSSTSV